MRRVIFASASALALIAVAGCSEQGEVTDQETVAEDVSETAGEASPSTVEGAEIGELVEEAASALEETQAAIYAIDSGNTDEAIDALARATGELEIILAREPSLALAPVGASVVEHDLLATPEAVKELRDRIEDLIDDDRLQVARRLMDGLASEMVVSVSNLPLATYPDAIKRAAALLDEQKPEEAKLVLLNALSTVVVTDTIIPLPIVRAEAHVAAAKELAAKEDRTAEDNQAIVAALAAAREQIELGQALGYATKQDLDNLLEAIDELEEETKGDNAAASFFERIGQLFERAREAVRSNRDAD
tara:strand:+ start:18402 stop:19316 length:915 start_codon:yes stop_codon:yes gene_type:complete